jgi:hypothetical protein
LNSNAPILQTGNYLSRLFYFNTKLIGIDVIGGASEFDRQISSKTRGGNYFTNLIKSRLNPVKNHQKITFHNFVLLRSLNKHDVHSILFYKTNAFGSFLGRINMINNA